MRALTTQRPAPSLQTRQPQRRIWRRKLAAAGCGLALGAAVWGAEAQAPIPGALHATGALHSSIAAAAARADSLDFNAFRATVEPILLRDRGGFGPSVSACVTCHVGSATAMKLQPVQIRADGSAYWTPEQSRLNYLEISRLVVPGAPERSLLLRQPLSSDAGGTAYHVGGKFWESTADPEWQAIAAWVRAADSSTLAAAPVEAPQLDFAFFQSCVQKVFLDKRPGKMECVNCHSGGVRGFAQSLPDGRAFWNEEESLENFGVLSRYIEAGEPERSRFLMHPLHPDAGGDHFHGGGRRWESKEDPEWQMLAAWVRGESPRCVL